MSLAHRAWVGRAAGSAPDRTMTGPTLLCVTLLAVALAAAPAVPAQEPLALDELLLLLRSGLSEDTIIEYVRARAVGDRLTPDQERTLRAAGASERLLVVLRDRGPRPPDASPRQEPRPGTMDRLRSQSPPGTPSFGASVGLVRVPVSVSDNRNRPVTGLERGDFRLWENGRAQQLDVFSTDRKPLRLAILLDVSGSMEAKVDEVADALKHFIELLEAEDQILILTFNDRLRVVQDFTADRKLLAKVLGRLRAAGGTALHDAVIEGLSRLGPGPVESKALVLISDGMDTASASSFRDVLEAGRRAEVPIYSIGLGHSRGFSHLGGPRVADTDFDARPLLELADQTGGRAEILGDVEHHHRGDVDRLRDAAEAIAAALRHRYVLGYQPSEEAAAGGWREIRVEVDRGSVSVSARKGYYSGR